MSTQTEQQLEDITALLMQPAVAEGEQSEFAIDLSQVVAKQTIIGNTATFDDVVLKPIEKETNVVTLEPISEVKSEKKPRITKIQKLEVKLAEAIEKVNELNRQLSEEKNRVAEKKAAPKRISANGVTAPKEGSEAYEVWRLCSEISETLGRILTARELLNDERTLDMDINKLTTLYNKWKKFYFTTE